MNLQSFRVTLAAALVLLVAEPVRAWQFGGIAPIDESSGSTQQVQTERQERGGSITISWSEKMDELSGFSNKSGRWQRLRIEPQDSIQPNCVEFVGAVRLKDAIAAYSGETGTWDVVHLPVGSTAMPAVSPDVAQFKEGEHFYAFSAVTGRWTSPTDPAMKPLAIHYLSPKHVSSAELHGKLIDWMQTVPASEVYGSIQWLDGVLSLLPRKKSWLEAAQAEIAKLDVPDPDARPSTDAGFFPAPAGGLSGLIGGGFDSGGSNGNARQVSSAGVMITWSENNDELRGFSNSLGEWETLKIEKQDTIIPVAGSGVAAVRIGDSIAAFSGIKGWWDVIPLSKGSAAQPIVSTDLVQIEDNGHLYTFAAAKGRWTSPTDPDLQPIHDQIDIQADPKAVLLAEWPFQQWLESLPRYEARGVRAQFSGAGFVDLYVERRFLLDEARAALNQGLKRHEGIVTEKSPAPVLDVATVEKKITDLRGELQQLELAVHAGSGTKDPLSAKQDDQQQALRTLVEKSFDLRQQLQRLEAQRMRLKLQLIETNLDARDKNREDIIQHRIDEMLDSNGKDPVRDTGDKTTSITKLGTPVTGTPIGLPGPPHLPVDSPADLGSHQANSGVRVQWPQPAEIVKDLRSKESAVEGNLQLRKMHQEHVEQWSKPLEQLKSEGIADPKMTEAYKQAMVDNASEAVRSWQSALDTRQRDWSRALLTYQSKLRLLRLDVDEVKLTLEPLQQNYDQLKRLHESGAVSLSEVTQIKSNLAIAIINLQRAEELLKLYADIETTEPELNPDSLKAEK